MTDCISSTVYNLYQTPVKRHFGVGVFVVIFEKFECCRFFFISKILANKDIAIAVSSGATREKIR